MDSAINISMSFLLAPLMLGVVNRTKAVFAGRTGKPLLQLYYDLFKLLHKGSVYSTTTTWIFKASPLVGLGVLFAVSLMTPFGRIPALISFPGDFLAIAYFFGLMRLWLVIAALDTGSSFEGMGASREVTFSLFAEIAFLLSMSMLAWKSGSFSLSQIFPAVTTNWWKSEEAVLGLVVCSLFIVLLAENARIPVDDPNTHLELTMIHEVMILDHSGPDLAFLLYASALKLWVLGTLIINIVIPVEVAGMWYQRGIFLAGMGALAVVVGIVESSMARLKLLHVPRLLIGASILAIFGLLFELR